MKNRALRTAGIVLMMLSAGFICYRLSKLDFSSIDIDFSFGSAALLVLSLLLSVMSVFILGILFALNVGKGKDGKRIPMKKAVYVYCRANLGKYIPGNVFQYIERNLFLSSYGISHTDTVLASVMEIVCLIIGGCVLSVSFGNFDVIKEAIGSYGYIIPVACVLLILAVVAFVIILRKKKKILQTVLKRLKERGGVKLLVLDIAAYSVILLIMGVAAITAFYAISGSSCSGPDITDLLGSYIAAWLCGFVIIGAPGGIGVREAVFSLIYINTPYLDAVLTLSILIRIVSILADIVAYVISWILSGKKQS